MPPVPNNVEPVVLRIQGREPCTERIYAYVCDLFSHDHALKMHFENDSPREGVMAVAALKQKPEPALKTFHATMFVTRAEEWCVEAESAEEARRLLAAGAGHRCHLGDCLHVEVESVED
jgi:hypothetical protein